MPCKGRKGGECEESEFEPGYCNYCAGKMVSTIKMGYHTRLPANQACIRIALVGHGTYHASDLSFVVPSKTTLYFKGGHGGNAMGFAMEFEGDLEHTLVNGQTCFNYRLWPMLGERHGVTSARLVPYHHAHRDEHSLKFRVGSEIYMYSARSGDGPRLSSIVERVRTIVGTEILLEFVWLACREVIDDNYAAQRNMMFTEPPIYPV